ncbi:MAG: SpoIID/LytB domain-containing protein [Spirochaetota bacterium]|jgi:SpoIID/LytB domain protein|nr:SpoIID/LytB domain-containing protein [Spirochaetota bacterium]
MKFGGLYFLILAIAAIGLYAAARGEGIRGAPDHTKAVLPTEAKAALPGDRAGVSADTALLSEDRAKASAIQPEARTNIPTLPMQIRLRVFSLESISELSIESASEYGSRASDTAVPDMLRVWDDEGVCIYSVDHIRLTARGNQLFLDGEEIAAPLSLYPARDAPVTAQSGSQSRAKKRMSVSTRTAPIRFRAARASRVFTAHSIQIFAHGGELIVIAALPLEDYIAGVLAVEAGPYASLPRDQAAQYLAAQSVACRSYAIYYLQDGRRHRNKYFDYEYCDSTHCQAWRDHAEAYPEIVLSAMRATRGMALRDAAGVRYAPGFYSSTAAASTVLPSEVWGGTELDIFFEPVTNRLPGEPEFLNKRSPFARWEWREKKETFRAFARNAFAAAWDGAPLRVEYSARGAARRIRFSANDRESILGYRFRDEYCRARGWGTLCSLHFSVRLEGDSIVFSGSGLGHGVGLCQYGAMELARRSWTWEQILRFYYPRLRCAEQ